MNKLSKMKQRKTVEQIRGELKAQEENIWGTIDTEAKKINKTLGKGIKSTSIIGGTVLVGYALTRLLTSNKKQQAKPYKAQSIQGKEVALRIASTALKALIPIAISKITEQINNTDS